MAQRHTIEFAGPDNRARGRNNWFVPATVDLWNNGEDHVVLDINSKRPGETAPIILYLAPADARWFAESILSQLGDQES